MGAITSRLQYASQYDEDDELHLQYELSPTGEGRGSQGNQVENNAAAQPAPPAAPDAGDHLFFGGNIFQRINSNDPGNSAMLPLLRRLANNTPTLSKTKTVKASVNVNKATVKLVPRSDRDPNCSSLDLYDLQFQFDTTSRCVVKVFYCVDEVFRNSRFEYNDAKDIANLQGVVPTILEVFPPPQKSSASTPGNPLEISPISSTTSSVLKLHYVERTFEPGIGQTFLTTGAEALDVSKYPQDLMLWNQAEEQLIEDEKAKRPTKVEDDDDEDAIETERRPRRSGRARSRSNESNNSENVNTQDETANTHPENNTAELEEEHDLSETGDHQEASTSTLNTSLSDEEDIEDHPDDATQETSLLSNEAPSEDSHAEPNAADASSSNPTRRRRRRRYQRGTGERRRSRRRSRRNKKLPSLPRPKDHHKKAPKTVRNLFPIIISIEPIPSKDDDGSQHSLVAAQITQLCLVKIGQKTNDELNKTGERVITDDDSDASLIDLSIPSSSSSYVAPSSSSASSSSGKQDSSSTKDSNYSYQCKTIRQKVLVNGIVYNVYDIYGIEHHSAALGNLADSSFGQSCVICMTDPKTTLVIPCRHLCLCPSCAETLKVQSVKCPICRGPVRSLLNIELSKDGESDTKESGQDNNGSTFVPMPPSSMSTRALMEDNFEVDDSDDDGLHLNVHRSV